MTRLRLLNLAAAACSLALSAAIALPAGSFERAQGLPDGTQGAQARGLTDATGHFVPFRPYRRIVSGSSVVDSLLQTLCEPERIAAFTHYGATKSPYGYRYAGKPAPAGIEQVIALQPDLVLLHNHGRQDLIARLRETEIEVFDLGYMQGISSLESNIHTVAQLLGHPERGQELARRFRRRMQDLARHIPVQERPRGMYLNVSGSSLFGGAGGSSYHDVIEAAGIRDAAAERYEGYPKYSSEQLLTLDPEVIVTHRGMTLALCRHPGLDRLRACGPDGRIVEVDGFLIGDPGLHMLEAAETVFEAVHTGDREARND